MLKMLDGDPRAGRRRRAAFPRASLSVCAARRITSSQIERDRLSAAARTATNFSIVALSAFRISGSMIRRLGAERRGELLHLLPHAFVRRVARVLVGEHAGVDVQARELLVEVATASRARRRASRRTKSACPDIAGAAATSPASLSFAVAPRRVARIDVGEVPFEFVRCRGPVAGLRGRGDGQRGQRQDEKNLSHRAILA